MPEAADDGFAPVEAFEPDTFEVSPEPEAAPLARLDGEPEDRYEPLPPKVRPGSIFEQRPANGLFTQPLSTQVSHFGWDNAIARAPEALAEAQTPSEPAIAPEPAGHPEETVAAPVDAVAAERIAGAPLDDLSHVELLERLALSMQRKRSGAAPAPAVEPVENSLSLEPQPEAAGSVAMHESNGLPEPPPVPVIPAALRPIGLDDDDDGDHLPAFVPPRHFGLTQQFTVPAPAPAPAEEEVLAEAPVEPPAPVATESGDADELEEGYSSLLSLSRSTAGQQRFIRIEEPAPLSAEIEPVVIFPGKEPVSGNAPFARPSGAAAAQPANPGDDRNQRDPEETDRALRTALANIQRMSGAA